MHLERILTICPFLLGSKEGTICKASGNLVRDMQDIHPDICISKHFEMCHIYIFTASGVGRTPCLSLSANRQKYLTQQYTLSIL